MGEPEQIPRYAVTTDVVIFTVHGTQLKLLLVQRANAPFQGQWALPGGFVDPDEDLENAARRELQEETGVTDVYLEQLGAFGAPGRDPRGRVITVAFFALVPWGAVRAEAASDAADVGWFDATALPSMAFDHAEIIALARQRLRERVSDASQAVRLLPDHFTLADARQVFEVIRG